MNSKLGAWLLAARLRTLPLSLSGILMGTFLALHQEKFDWKIFENAKVDLPFFLSGGISPLDVGDLRHFASIKPAQNLVAFDINSKFENKYGVKDIKMIKNFVIEINGSK
mgnify:CR=1 FL=1